MRAPWPIGEQCKVMDDYLNSLQLHSPTAKYSVARKLYSVSKASNVCPAAPEKQSTPLLATCFGNRSAALYELGRTEV